MGLPLLVLDVDDTLYLERDYAKSGFAAVDAHVRENYGSTGFFERAWGAFNAGRRGTIFDEAASADPTLRGRAGLIPELVDMYRSHVPNIALLPDARQFLDARSGRVHFAVVTDGPTASQHAKVAALALHRWSDEIVITADRGTNWTKPSTLAFEFLQDVFQVAPSECAYFGDNPQKDFLGPKRLGWRTFRVRRPGGLHFSAAEDGGADVTVESFDKVILEP